VYLCFTLAVGLDQILVVCFEMELTASWCHCVCCRVNTAADNPRTRHIRQQCHSVADNADMSWWQLSTHCFIYCLLLFAGSPWQPVPWYVNRQHHPTCYLSHAPRTLQLKHPSCDDCLEDKREDYQNCSVLYCVLQLYTVVCTLMWALITVN